MRRLAALAALAVVAALQGPAALAGDDNEAFIRQVSPSGSTSGNTLRVDQSLASATLVRGIGSNLAGGIPTQLLSAVTGNDPLVAQQRGEGNDADLRFTVGSSGGELQIYQSVGAGAQWVPGGAQADNIAVLVAATDALGGVLQIGTLNTAELTLDQGATGLIAQFGSRLSSDLTVRAGASGTIVQSGYNSTTGAVTVDSGSLTYVQIGNNLTASNGVSLYTTTGGNVTITQTGW